MLLVVFCAISTAQTVNVYSEFARVDASGNVTAPETPREILSPMLVRNGFTSFQVVVQAPSGKQWQLHLGQNPENAVQVTLYRESGDALEAVTLPVDGEGTQVFWMDLWAAGSAKVERIKVEPELNIDNDWVIYPIEGRVVDAVAPGAAGNAEKFCGLSWTAPRGSAHTVSGMHSRNAAQDSALAQGHQTDELRKIAASCAQPASDPERYLRIRDYLFGLR